MEKFKMEVGVEVCPRPSLKKLYRITYVEVPREPLFQVVPGSVYKPVSEEAKRIGRERARAEARAAEEKSRKLKDKAGFKYPKRPAHLNPLGVAQEQSRKYLDMWNRAMSLVVHSDD